MAIKYAVNGGFLTSLLGQRSKVEALRCLFAHDQELSGREIARRTGLSHLAVHKALGDLAQAGIVERRRVPPTCLFQMNRARWEVVEILAPMFRKETAWREHLERRLRQGLPRGVVSLILFGSVVSGPLKPRSDIDLLVLAPDAARREAWADGFHDLAADIFTRFGHPLSVVVMPQAEFAARCRQGDGFAKAVSYSGRVIHGRLLTEVLAPHDAQEH